MHVYNACTYTQTHACKHALNIDTVTHMHIYVFKDTHIHTHVHTYIHMYLQTQAYTHVHTYTHILQKKSYFILLE